MLGERRSGSYYFLHDGLGSVTAVIDASGTVVSTFKYDPYGGDAGTTGSLYEPIRFTGGYWDGSISGHEALYKFGERYYDPALGRWTQPDPINNPLDLHGWNGYAYAGDDPVNMIDPTGLCIPGTCWVKHTVHRVNRWRESSQDWYIRHVARPVSEAAGVCEGCITDRRRTVCGWRAAGRWYRGPIRRPRSPRDPGCWRGRLRWRHFLAKP
jgi:RHS repeat-associated protein